MAPSAAKSNPLAGRTPLFALVLVALLLALGWSWLHAVRPVQPGRAVPAATTMPGPSPAVADMDAPIAPPFASNLTPEEERAQQQSVFSAFETRFRGDTLDSSWSAPAEKQLIDAASEPSLTQLGVPLSYNASCTGHMCKLNLSFARRTEADDWSELYVNGMGGIVSSVRSAVLPNADGTTDLVIYAVRSGSESLLFDPPGTHVESAAPPRR